MSARAVCLWVMQWRLVNKISARACANLHPFDPLAKILAANKGPPPMCGEATLWRIV
jgi:hypothetical protein